MAGEEEELYEDEDTHTDEEGEPTDTGESSLTPPAEEQPVTDPSDDGDRPDVDWSERATEGEARQHQTFTSQPVPPYFEGDIWTSGSDTYMCVNAKTSSQSFVSTDWELYAPEPPVPAPTYTTIEQLTSEIVTDFSAQALADYEDSGAQAVAIYDDGTEVEVQWSQVTDPSDPAIDVENEAAEVAEATNQHFWSRVDNTDGAGAGAFVTDDKQDAFKAAAQNSFPDIGDATDTSSFTDTFTGDGEKTEFELTHTATTTTYTVLVDNVAQTSGTDYTPTTSKIAFATAPSDGAVISVAYTGYKKPWHNLLMNSLGILIRTALVNLVSITRSAIAFFDGEGNNAQNVTASFGPNGAQIGKSGGSHVNLDYHSLQLKDKEGSTYFWVSDLRDEDGEAVITEEFVGTGYTYYFTVSMDVSDEVSAIVESEPTNTATRNGRTYTFSTAPGLRTRVIIVYKTTSPNAKALTFGNRGEGSIGPYSFVVGNNSVAGGGCSFAQGNNANATGHHSHAQGINVVANGVGSHAEGYGAKAMGRYSHAEGNGSIALGDQSHAGGSGTHAGQSDQTVIGTYNVVGTSGLLVIGNGTSDSNRSNALTVDSSGNVETAGDVTANGKTLTRTRVKGNAESSYRTGDVNLTPANIGALALTGGVLTGGLYIDDATIDRDAANPSADQISNQFIFRDKNDERIGLIRCARLTDGRIQFSLAAFNENSGTEVGNWLNIFIAKNGAQTYSVSNAANFRSAIGAQASGSYAAKGWTNLGSFTNLNSKTYDLTNYSEVIYATRLGSDIYSAIVPKAQLDTTTRYLYLTGGKGGSSTAGRQAVLAVTSTKVTGYNFTKDSSAVTSGVTTWVYAR